MEWGVGRSGLGSVGKRAIMRLGRRLMQGAKRFLTVGKFLGSFRSLTVAARLKLDFAIRLPF